MKVSSRREQFRRGLSDPRIRCSLFCSSIAATVAAFLFLLSFSTVSVDIIAFLVLLLFLLLAFGRNLWLFSLQSSVLGFLFSYCLFLAFWTSDHKLSIFLFYIVCLSLFHYSEFMFTGFTSPSTLDHSSFLLDHSLTYWIAAVGSWVEFFIEYLFVPKVKNVYVSYVGFVTLIIGEVFRKLAMVHADGAFTHFVARYKRSNHVLVTNGIYSVVRHPGYAGWFIWCIGTQILLCNPFCVVIFGISAWFFFRQRIFDEERLLINFFGDEYRVYQNSVVLGIPFIQGYHDS